MRELEGEIARERDSKSKRALESTRERVRERERAAREREGERKNWRERAGETERVLELSDVGSRQRGRASIAQQDTLPA